MTNSNVNLNMMLGWVGEVDWKLPEISDNNNPQVPVEMDIPDIEKSLGFRIKFPNLGNVSKLRAGVLPKISTYFGELSEGSIIGYKYGDNSKRFVIIQRRLLNSNLPKLFLYPKKYVRAYQKRFNNCNATIVLFREEDKELASFATVTIEDMVLEIIFHWKIDEMTVNNILDSIQ